VIVTVTPNPAWDVTIEAPRVVHGATNVVAPARRRAGGKGINVARVLASRGVSVVAVAPVGTDDTDAFQVDLATVPHRLVGCAARTRSTYAIVESDSGVTTMITERGRAHRAGEWDLLHAVVREQLIQGSCLVVSGSLPPESPTGSASAFVSAAHDAGSPVIADLAGAHLLEAAKAGADVLKPNRDELQDAVGTADPLAGARALQDLGAGVVVVSLGADGLVVVPRTASDDVWRARTAGVLTGNPAGAGDAAVAAIACLISAGVHDPAIWAHDAAAWAAAAVLAPLAGELSAQSETSQLEIVLSEY